MPITPQKAVDSLERVPTHYPICPLMPSSGICHRRAASRSDMEKAATLWTRESINDYIPTSHQDSSTNPVSSGQIPAKCP